MVAFFKRKYDHRRAASRHLYRAGFKTNIQKNDNEYLFDLVLNYIPALLSVRVLRKISDHRVVCVDVHVTAPSYAPIQLTVWDMQF